MTSNEELLELIRPPIGTATHDKNTSNSKI